jgi:hypothetical protein
VSSPHPSVAETRVPWITVQQADHCFRQAQQHYAALQAAAPWSPAAVAALSHLRAVTDRLHATVLDWESSTATDEAAAAP